MIYFTDAQYSVFSVPMMFSKLYHLLQRCSVFLPHLLQWCLKFSLIHFSYVQYFDLIDVSNVSYSVPFNSLMLNILSLLFYSYSPFSPVYSSDVQYSVAFTSVMLNVLSHLIKCCAISCPHLFQWCSVSCPIYFDDVTYSTGYPNYFSDF